MSDQQQPEGAIERLARLARRAQSRAANLVPGMRPIVETANNAPYAIYGPEEEHNGKGDALRHMLVQGMLTQKYGPRTARAVGWLHEGLLGIGQPDAEADMDRFNDALGRSLGGMATDPEARLRLARYLVDSGSARTIAPEQNYADGGPVHQAVPQNRLLGALSKYAQAAKEFGDNVPLPELLGGGLGSLLVGNAPEELESWSYGDYPFEVPEMSYVPQAKSQERALNTVDVLGSVPVLGAPARVAAALPSAVRRAALDFAEASAGAAPRVIKPRGGNWLTGSVEGALSGLKSGLARVPGGAPDGVPPGVSWRGWDAALRGESGGAEFMSELQGSNPEAYSRLAPNVALNSWIDKQLTRYVKNDMATPEDPIRALAEQGVLHVDPNTLNRLPHQDEVDIFGLAREHEGFLPMGYAQAPGAKSWELASDLSVYPKSSTALRENAADLQLNPWLAKVPDDTKVYDTTRPDINGLGFTHLIDELRNAINPESGLPPELLLKYESLPRVSVPQAVERVAKINAWRAAQQAEANKALAMNPATHLVKEYPEGYRWVELRDAELDPKGGYSPELEDALRYEGDTMGHCVGGYCDDVASGVSRIFSLRDAKGQPHVTIEVESNPISQNPRDQTFSQERLLNEFGEEGREAWEGYQANKKSYLSLGEYLQKNYPDISARQFKRVAPSISQIKGKSNLKPNAEYIPFVQDFVRSQGPWSDVGDLHNTDLLTARDLADGRLPPGIREALDKIQGANYSIDEYERRRLAAPQLGEGYFTTDEWLKHLGYARGGSVQSHTGFNLADVDARVEALAAELGL